LSYFIPIRGNGKETRVECINPKLITETEYEDVRKKLDFITKKYEEIYGEATK
jgi:tetrahydromethanopterin S-methyltransferase subunit G